MRPCRAAGENLLPVLLQPRKEIAPVDQPVFRDFRITGAEFTRAQRIQNFRIGQNKLRLIEDADEVLAVRRVDAGLAADRRIHLRQERSRHLHEIHAAPHDTGHEAGKIADDTAAERHDRIAALQPGRQHGIGDRFQRAEGFGFLARRNNHRRYIDPCPGKALGKPLQMRPGDILVGHHRHAHAFQTLRHLLARTINQPLADQNIVGAVAERHRDSGDTGSGGRSIHA